MIYTKYIVFLFVFVFFSSNTEAKTLKIVQDTIREDMSDAEFAQNELLQSDYDVIFRTASLSKLSFYTFLISALIAPFVTGAAAAVFLLFVFIAIVGQWAIFNFTKKFRRMFRAIDDEHPDYEVIKYITKLSNFFFYITIIPALLTILSIVAVRFIDNPDFELEDYAVIGGLAFLVFNTFIFLKEDIQDLIKRKK